MTGRYRIYGNLESRETIVLTTVLMAKGLAADLVEVTPSLVLALAARSGQDSGPYLRTPDGFVLGELHGILNWIESVHPEPELIPSTPVRRICTRLLEDWIEFWLPLWPGRSWATLEGVGAHLRTSQCLLGATPTRSDWLLAGWLEADVLDKARAREHLAKVAPRLLRFGEDLLESSSVRVEDDAIPISLLGILQDLSRDYHAYLISNQESLKDHEDRVSLDLGLGKWAFPTRRICESRRVEIAQELRALEHEDRQAVRRVLEPVGAWHVLTLPEVLDTTDPTDPRAI
jgi:hypothetical protein